jgi:aryl-alcohol dehydrogenase-like predicted oxidoreductase
MEKMRLGKSNLMVTRIGFGGIPIQRLNEEDAVAVVRRCLDHGINFIDTANAYTTSEGRIGKAIAGRRDSLIIATKTTNRSREGIIKHLDNSLKQLGTDYIDLYQFHAVSDFKSLDLVMDPEGPVTAMEGAKKAGKIRHIGITSHQIDVAKKAVELGRFETLMFPFNFVTDEAAAELLPLCRKHDVGFIDMKPLAGGMIADARIAFKFLFQFKDVATIPGIQKLEEIDEIVQIFNGPLDLTEFDRAEMRKLKEQLGTRFCHRCDYCQPCKEGIAISSVMTFPSFVARMPEEHLFGFWGALFEPAAKCTKCGECEERCPYHLPIRDLMEEYYDLYEKKKKAYKEKMAAK